MKRMPRQHPWTVSDMGVRHVTICLILVFVPVNNALVRLQRTSEGLIRENINDDVDLFSVKEDIQGIRTGSSFWNFQVTGTTVEGSDLFFVTPWNDGGKLRLKPDLSEIARKLFDYETHPEIFVNFSSTNVDDASDVIEYSIKLRLDDVNDEFPEFTNKPVPFLAVVGETPQSGTVVFVVTAKDPDTRSRVILDETVSQPQGFRWVLGSFTDSQVLRRGSTVTYSLVIIGDNNFQLNEEIDVPITVEDESDTTNTQVTSATVKVKVGKRPPQIYNENYKAYIYETTGENKVQRTEVPNDTPLEIMVKQFQNGPLTIRLLENGVVSDNYAVQDNKYIVNKKDVVFAESSQKSKLTIEVTENAGTPSELKSTAQLEIQVIDENDNSPVFTLSNYPVTYLESAASGDLVVTVTASDPDSGQNGEIVFSVDDDNFTVDTIQQGANQYRGVVRVAKPLDYELVGSTTYIVQVTAHDKGPVQLSANTRITINLQNVNDNPPVISLRTDPIKLLESAPDGSVVFVVRASDPDGDSFTFSIKSPTSVQSTFSIDTQGIVRLKGSVGADVPEYSLVIMATDTGSCCQPTIIQSSSATFTISIVDVNEDRPDFTECSSYESTQVPELSVPGTFVQLVSAQDNDRGDNAVVIYSLFFRDELDTSRKFEIDSSTGNITVKEEFSREIIGSDHIQVTVQGKNPGVPIMEGWCTFRVTIIDINNHPPIFKPAEMTVSLPQNTVKGGVVTIVRATDKDTGANANITYTLETDDVTQKNVFTINAITGLITLENSLISGVEAYNVRVVANDNGRGEPNTGTLTLTIKVEGQGVPPIWRDASMQYEINEVIEYGTTIATLYCSPNLDTNHLVQFFVFEENMLVTSTLFGERSDYIIDNDGYYKMELISLSLSPYDVRKEYQITVTCKTTGQNSAQADINPKIKVKDVNNNMPQFQGLNERLNYVAYIPENAEAGYIVIDVSATDADVLPGNRDVTFSFGEKNSLIDPDPTTLFQITNVGSNRARVSVTQALASILDRETRNFYVMVIQAEDGTPAIPPIDPDNTSAPHSVDRNIQVHVTDVNDKEPFFNSNEFDCNASETLTAGATVCTVKAEDEDDLDVQGLTYYFDKGNTDNAFSVKNFAGDITVNGKLDYESNTAPKTYLLGLVARDGVGHTASTNVKIHVIDMNDNKPVFTQRIYTVTDMVEENNKTTSPQNPMFLVQVSATDADISRTETDIKYSLRGTYTEQPNQKFIIDQNNGNIFLTGMLDREETNNPTFSFNVLAEDEPDNPNVGYATVQVTPIDVNDNKPEFDEESLQGNVNEHSSPQTSVCTILASDKDAGNNAKVDFRKADTQVSDQEASYFRVADNGEVFTDTDSANLDRETKSSFYVVILAYDDGNPRMSATGTLTITLNDINDQSPEFDKDLYNIVISENTQIGAVETITATDGDSHPEHTKLFYTIAPMNYFSVFERENSAVITLNKVLDYESGHNEFDLVLTVRDNNPNHNASTKVHITVRDFNDHKPIFEQAFINVTLQEEEPAGQNVTTFSATDGDGTSPNNQFTYSIDQGSDRFFEFFINPTTGLVTTRKPLDREKDDTRTIYILATDQGENPLTSTATLEVHLVDINDNAPRFLEDYRPVVEENKQFNDVLVVEVKAMDPDTPKYGPPFHFKLPDGCSTPACQKFTLTFSSGGDNNRGSAFIRTSSKFDREVQKKYYLPIIISDMEGSSSPEAQSATNTLTITIGDQNDNPHGPGHQDIFSYVMGASDVTKESMEIGQVFVEDPDDWDLKDKTFTNVQPVEMGDYFFVDKDTGMITVQKGVPVPADQKPYTFQVTVTDSVHTVTVTSTVSVRLVTLSEQAVYKAGTMRLAGITGAEFISKARDKPNAKSKFDLFEEQMSTILGYPPAGRHVQIVSLNEVGQDLDVRFAAHGSPYLNPAQVESAVMLNKQKVEDGVGVDIKQVPVNLCQDEVYYYGCSTVADVTGRSHLTNANGTSFVGAETIISAESGCSDYMFPKSNECTGDYCFNGGTCVKDDWDKLSCRCSAGFDGPRCQQRRHHFGGNEVAFYKDLEACSLGRTSFDFITEQENGIIMYSGPTMNIDLQKDAQDFLVLELSGGYPKLRINLGAGETWLQLDGLDQSGTRRMSKLNDGKWHHIDIDKSDQDITMMVDYCNSAEVFNGSITDWSPCYIRNTVPGGDILLVTGGFLHLGNRYPMNNPPSYPVGVGTQGFNGCLRNLVHNTKLYDLHYRNIPSISSGENGCPQEESICGTNSDDPFCGVNAACESQWLPTQQVTKCTCHPGWYGDKCGQNTPIKDFNEKSFVKWKLGSQVITNSLRDQSIDIMFRTRQMTGNLFTMTDNEQHRILLELVEGHPSVSYDLGQGIQKLTLENSVANTGQWHMVRLERHGNDLSLRLDGGEGRNYNYIPSQMGVHVIYESLPFVSSGASVPSVESAPIDDFISDDFINSCVQDIRFDELFLPMEEFQTLNGSKLIDEQNVDGDCNRDDCAPNLCNKGTCYPLWDDYECRCPWGLLETGAGQCPNLCEPNPCFHAEPCSVVEDTFKCQCKPGWQGDLCNILAVVSDDDDDDDGLAAGAIAGIVIGIIVLLALIALIILFFLCRKDDDEERIVKVDPDDDFIRENVMFYDDEGAGEMDNQGYDMSVLTIPNDRMRETPFIPSSQPYTEQTKVGRSGSQDLPTEVDNSRPHVRNFIDNRIKQAEDPDEDPFTDSVHQFNHEGGGSDAGSLSSLNTASSDGSQDYDFLGDWGHKFARLADMYGAGQNLDKE